jgi:hypothetical protein
MESDKIVQLPPAAILADSNSRYAIGKADIDAMKAAIQEAGGVLVPLEVEALGKEEAEGGVKYRLTTGFRRHRAVAELNADGAGLTLPCIVRAVPDEKTRLMHQLSENIDRKTLSPMDTAVAIKAAFDAGFTRLQIREMFKRPGGVKGTTLQPASNAWVNMLTSFLDLPKALRDKIHNGVIGVAAAYELTKLPPDRQAEVVAKAEEDLAKQIEREEKEEAKYLASHAKLEAVAKAEDETASALDTAQAELELAERALAVKEEDATLARKSLKTAEKSRDKQAIKEAKEVLGAAEADVKGLGKKVERLAVEKEKLEKKVETVKTTAASLREKLAAARKPVAKPAKAVGSGDVKKAAKETGASAEHVPLKLAEVRKFIDDLSLAPQPKVAAIGSVVKECIAGVTTPGMALKKLLALTGEPAKTAKK